MDCKNTGVFSPIRNLDEEKNKRRTDSFSKFLRGPDVFKKNFGTSENVDENSPVGKNLSKKSSKTHRKKAVKNDTQKSEETSSSSISTTNSLFITSPEQSNSFKKDKLENLPLTSKRNKDIAINFVTKRNDKSRTNQKHEVECGEEKSASNSVKKDSGNFIKGSVPSTVIVVPEVSASKEIKKIDELSSTRKHNPLSQIQSGVFEKLINDAVESRFDDIQQLLYSQHFELQKSLFNTMEKMEQRHVADQATLFKIIEALLEENRSLRNAVLACQ